MYIQARINKCQLSTINYPSTYKIMINSMTIAVPWENLGHLLQHVVDGLDLLEGQAGEVGVDLQLTTQLPGPKCSDSSSWEARCQNQPAV